MKSFPSYTQLDAMDCGPTCLRNIAQYYGRHYSLQNLRKKCHITREGVSLLGISDAAELIGFRTTGAKVTLRQLCDEVQLPLRRLENVYMGKSNDCCIPFKDRISDYIKLHFEG